jgi:MFS family permease
VTGLAATLGPVIGGAVTEGLAWQWIFWLNVPIGLVAIPLVLARTPESRGPRTALDGPGLLLAGAASFGLVWALIRATVTGWASAQTLLPLAAGGLALVAFIVVARRTAAPMLPLRLFSSRAFAAGNVAIFLLNATLTGVIFFAAQYFQVAAGHGPLAAGLRLLPLGILPLLIGPRAGALADRFGSRPLVVAGGLALTAGTGWWALASGASYGWLLAPLTLIGAGVALAIPALTRAVVSQVAPPDLARASGTFSTLRQLGGAFGVAVLGTVFAGAAGSFGDRFVPVLVVAALLALGATVAGLLLPAASAPMRSQAAPSAVAVR